MLTTNSVHQYIEIAPRIQYKLDDINRRIIVNSYNDNDDNCYYNCKVLNSLKFTFTYVIPFQHKF